MTKLRIFSFFSGCGFLDLGFEKAGFPIDLVNEYSSSFINAYIYSREHMGFAKPKYGYSNIDINEYLSVRLEELQQYIRLSKVNHELVGFIGGPPCPDFSVAGKQKGRNGDNGKLSQSYIDLIVQQHPDFFLFENVKGLWRIAKHRAYYDELKAELMKAGYVLTDRLTNALEFGAPQDRDRILLFGVCSSVLGEMNLDIRNFLWTSHARYSLNEIKSKPWPKADTFVSEQSKPCPQGIIEELTVQYWFVKNDVCHHPNANDHFIPRNGLSRMQTVDEGDDSKKSYKRIHRWRYAPTICFGNNEVHLHPYKERRLSIAEALSLQSLPKEFVLPPQMSLTDKFKTVGNGVPYLLSRGIAETIKDFFDGGNNECQK